nr:MAG TPA: hypothetical protein [Caudoviricetes sp.]
MTTATVFRTTWTADNVHITDHKPEGLVAHCERRGVAL